MCEKFRANSTGSFARVELLDVTALIQLLDEARVYEVLWLGLFCRIPTRPQSAPRLAGMTG